MKKEAIKLIYSIGTKSTETAGLAAAAEAPITLFRAAMIAKRHH